MLAKATPNETIVFRPDSYHFPCGWAVAINHYYESHTYRFMRIKPRPLTASECPHPGAVENIHIPLNWETLAQCLLLHESTFATVLRTGVRCMHVGCHHR